MSRPEPAEEKLDEDFVLYVSYAKSEFIRLRRHDQSLCELAETLSSLQELFARRGTPNERSEVLRMFDDLIRNATKVLGGQEKPTPTLMVMLRMIAPCYSHLVNAMPVKSRVLWLLTLLKDKPISQRTQLEKLRSRDLSNMIEADKKKLQQKEDMFRESMATKETHNNSLQEEIKRLSREIDAHTQKIVDLNTKL